MTSDEIDHYIKRRACPQYNKADEFCKNNFGNSITDLGWEDRIIPTIQAGHDAIEACRILADKYDLDYIWEFKL